MGGGTAPHEDDTTGMSNRPVAGIVPSGGDEDFVVVEPEQETHDEEVSGKGERAPAAALPHDSGLRAVRGAQPSAGAAASATTSPAAGTSSPPAGPAGAAADAAAEAAQLLGNFLYAEAAAAYALLRALAAAVFRTLRAHGTVAFEFLYAHAVVVFEFLYAYTTVGTRKAVSLARRGRSCVGSALRGVGERTPASVKRAIKRKDFRAKLAVAVTALVAVFAAHRVMTRGDALGGGGDKLSAQDWQAKHNLLSSKYSADAVRHRLKYDSLAGRHLELQQEYETLLKELKYQQQRAVRAARDEPKIPQETCIKAGSLLGTMKEAFKAAEQSAFEYLGHFSEGLREDVSEIAERYFGKRTNQGLGVGDGGRAEEFLNARSRTSEAGGGRVDGEVDGCKGYRGQVDSDGGSSTAKQEKALNKMAEKILNLSKEMQALKARGFGKDGEREEPSAAEAASQGKTDGDSNASAKHKKTKSNDKKSKEKKAKDVKSKGVKTKEGKPKEESPNIESKRAAGELGKEPKRAKVGKHDDKATQPSMSSNDSSRNGTKKEKAKKHEDAESEDSKHRENTSRTVSRKAAGKPGHEISGAEIDEELGKSKESSKSAKKAKKDKKEKKSKAEKEEDKEPKEKGGDKKSKRKKNSKHGKHE